MSRNPHICSALKRDSFMIRDMRKCFEITRKKGIECGFLFGRRFDRLTKEYGELMHGPICEGSKYDLEYHTESRYALRFKVEGGFHTHPETISSLKAIIIPSIYRKYGNLTIYNTQKCENKGIAMKSNDLGVVKSISDADEATVRQLDLKLHTHILFF